MRISEYSDILLVLTELSWGKDLATREVTGRHFAYRELQCAVGNGPELEGPRAMP